MKTHNCQQLTGTFLDSLQLSNSYKEFKNLEAIEIKHLTELAGLKTQKALF